MKKYFLKSILILFLTGCSTLQVQTDYNEEFDFKSLSKFFVIQTKKNDGKDFARAQIGRVLTNHFKSKGYSLSQKSEADFYVVFHLNIQTKNQVETNYETMDLYPVIRYDRRLVPRPLLYNQYLDRVTTATTQTYEYKEGRLVIELVDVKSNAVFWQGIAKDELSELSTPEEKKAYINTVIGKVLEKFPKKQEMTRKRASHL